MTYERWHQIEELFNLASEQAEERRSQFLEESCAGDEELRLEVESLLSQAEPEDSFLGRSYLSLGMAVINSERTTLDAGHQIGHYMVIRLIGSGGMGEVYLSEDPRLDRLVALKVLPSYVTAQASIDRFKREARATSSISHPNVAHIYEIGDADGRVFTAMEFVDGDTLRTRLSMRKLTLGSALDIAIQVGSALAAAHARGVVHRDIKPENIMIRGDGLVKVVDFGLAKLTERPHDPAANSYAARRTDPNTVQTEPGLLMGTATYMSPEQARGQDTDHRTDIWSLGVVVYEMLTGVPPFAGLSNSDTIAEILKSSPEIAKYHFPKPVAALIESALKKDKNDRTAAASEMVDALKSVREILSSENVLELRLPLEAGGDGLRFAENRTSKDAGTAVVRKTGLSEIITGNLPVLTSGPTNLHSDQGRSEARRREEETTAARYHWWLRAATAALVVVGLAALAVLFSKLAGTTVEPAANKAARQLEISELTEDGRIKDAAISPDGRKLAYVPIESGSSSLWIRDLVTLEEVQLLPSSPVPYWGPRFARDGRSLFYITKDAADPEYSLWQVPIRGGETRKLVENIVAPPAVSPDNDHLAFIRSYPSQQRDALVIIDRDGSREQELASRAYPDRFSSSSVSWSPDGKLIAAGIGRNNDAEFAIAGVPVDGRATVELTKWQWAAIGGLAWENNGEGLIVSARPAGSKMLGLWRLTYPSGELRNISKDGNAYEEVTLSDSADALVTIHTYEVSDVWAYDRSDHYLRLTTQGHEGADGLTVLPSGRVIYTHGEYEQSVLWSMDLDGANRRPLTGNNAFLPSASRAGTPLIAYVSTQGGTRHIWLTGADGEQNRPLTDGDGENGPSITPDGRWVVYTSLGSNSGDLWKISTDRGSPSRLTEGGLYTRPAVSPDGSMIAALYRTDHNDPGKIAVISIEGGRPLKIIDLPEIRDQLVRWSDDSKGLIYVETQGGAQNLWRKPLDGTQASRITNFTEDRILHHGSLLDTAFIVSRGGRRRNITLIRDF